MTITSEPTTATSADVSDLPHGRRVVRFDQMAESITDRVDNPSEAGVEYYVGLEHLDPDSLKIRRWGTPDDVEATKLRFKTGDIIFGRRRAYQRKLAVADFEGICSAHALVLRAHEDVVLPEFLPFFMQSETFFQRAMAISVGSLSPTINWKTLAQQEFAIPPIDEQRRIAEILWAADDNRQAWEKCLTDSQTLLQCVINQVFANDDWTREALAYHVSESAYGPRFSNSRYSTTGAIGCIRTTDLLADGTIIYETVPLANLDIDAYASHILHEGDFLISRSGTCGIGAVYTEQLRPMLPGAFLIRLRLRGSLDPWFLKEYINSSIGQDQIRSLQQGGVQKNIRGSSLLKEHIPVPSLVDQLNSVALIASIRSRVRDIESFLAKQKSLTTAILREMPTLTAGDRE